MGLSDYIFVCLMKDQITSLELGYEINEHNVSFLTSHLAASYATSLFSNPDGCYGLNKHLNHAGDLGHNLHCSWQKR